MTTPVSSGPYNALACKKVTLTYASSSLELGVLGAGAKPVFWQVDFKTAFNAGTTNSVSVTSTNTNSESATPVASSSLDESTTNDYTQLGGKKLVYDTTYTVNYAQTGTAATAGEVDVYVFYYPHSN